MKIVINPDGTKQIEGTPEELAEFERIHGKPDPIGGRKRKDGRRLLLDACIHEEHLGLLEG